MSYECPECGYEQEEPGRCPACDVELEKVEEKNGEEGEWEDDWEEEE